MSYVRDGVKGRRRDPANNIRCVVTLDCGRILEWKIAFKPRKHEMVWCVRHSTMEFIHTITVKPKTGTENEPLTDRRDS